LREVATAYTGSNVSITIGDNFLMNAFGISYELSQNKRPIYGYNSMYYDSVASGQVIILGQLYVNFQHPNYLSTILSEYYRRNAPSEGQRLVGSSVGQTYRRNNGAFKGEYLNRGGSARQERTVDNVLNNIFSDPKLMSDYLEVFFAGQVSGTKDVLTGANGSAIAIQPNEGDSLVLPGNLSYSGRRNIGAKYGRPDQFTDNGSNFDPINIVVTYGNPGINSENSGILTYSNTSSIVLRGVHFIGEAQQIMADDQPIMETYKFIARAKETLVSRKGEQNREPEPADPNTTDEFAPGDD
jgi:hypothetical protein